MGMGPPSLAEGVLLVLARLGSSDLNRAFFLRAAGSAVTLGVALAIGSGCEGDRKSRAYPPTSNPRIMVGVKEPRCKVCDASVAR